MMLLEKLPLGEKFLSRRRFVVELRRRRGEADADEKSLSRLEEDERSGLFESTEICFCFIFLFLLLFIFCLKLFISILTTCVYICGNINSGGGGGDRSNWYW